MNSRRTFIKKAAAATLLAVFFDPLKSLFAATGEEKKLPAWTELVDYARWCPNVHNLQPHRLKIISETEAELYYEPSRLLPVGDPKAIFVTVALGIFVEHLSIAAAPYGAKVEFAEVFGPVRTDATAPVLFAKLKLGAATEPETLDRELIKKRRTSRLHYDGNPLKQNTLDLLKTECEKFGHSFFSSSEKEITDFIIGLNQEALFDDLGSKENREELDRLFRYTKEEAETKKDGLWSKCMCFPGGLMKSVFHHHEKWEKGLRKKMLANHYKHSFKGSTTMCWIGGDFYNTTDWLNTGRMLARTWLTVTKEGAYIHPFGSLITNEKANKKIKERLTLPPEGKELWFLFRTGYSKEPTRSFRLSTDELILK